ncbi:hypothetical protein J4E83_009599 [Alternaria metachromatica]|uniref:uncharacterized protein n=1 Tax=Alternaria metachromatica TaxID=283354 RepID=UPI0020C4C748|nr:uncharacterized protein J4E83_009599 [Alternaria metachromatica]KAI4607416.1 hypothetical protein J4E83_009599 [Alternaria metachromatica]
MTQVFTALFKSYKSSRSMESTRQLRPKDCVIPFGPYKNQTLDQIYQFDSNYIRQLMNTVDDLRPWPELHRIISGIKVRQHDNDKENTKRQSPRTRSALEDVPAVVAGSSGVPKSILRPSVRTPTLCTATAPDINARSNDTVHPYKMTQKEQRQSSSRVIQRQNTPTEANTSKCSVTKPSSATVTINPERAGSRCPEFPGMVNQKGPHSSVTASLPVPGAFPTIDDDFPHGRDAQKKSIPIQATSGPSHVTKQPKLARSSSALFSIEEQIKSLKGSTKSTDHPSTEEHCGSTLSRPLHPSDADSPIGIDDYNTRQTKAQSVDRADSMKSCDINVTGQFSREGSENVNVINREPTVSPVGLRRGRHDTHEVEPRKKRRMTSLEAVEDIHSHVSNLQMQLQSTGGWLFQKTDDSVTRAASKLETKVETATTEIHGQIRDFQSQISTQVRESCAWLRDQNVPANQIFTSLHAHISTQSQNQSDVRMAQTNKLNTSIKAASGHIQSRLRKNQKRQNVQFMGVRSRLKELRGELQRVEATIQHQGSQIQADLLSNSSMLAQELRLVQKGQDTSTQQLQDIHDRSLPTASSLEAELSTVITMIRGIYGQLNPDSALGVQPSDRRTLFQTLSTIETTVERLGTHWIPTSEDATEQASGPARSEVLDKTLRMVEQIHGQLAGGESLAEGSNVMTLDAPKDQLAQSTGAQSLSPEVVRMMEQHHMAVLERFELLGQQVAFTYPESSQSGVEEIDFLLVQIEDARRVESQIELHIIGDLEAQLAHERAVYTKYLVNAAVQHGRNRISLVDVAPAEQFCEDDGSWLRPWEAISGVMAEADALFAESDRRHLAHELHCERRRNTLRETRLQFMPKRMDIAIEWDLELVESQAEYIQLLTNHARVYPADDTSLALPVDALGHTLPSGLRAGALGRDLPSALALATDLFTLQAQNAVRTAAEKVHEEDSARLFKGLEGMRKYLSMLHGRSDLVLLKRAIENLQVGREWNSDNLMGDLSLEGTVDT